MRNGWVLSVLGLYVWQHSTTYSTNTAQPTPTSGAKVRSELCETRGVVLSGIQSVKALNVTNLRSYNLVTLRHTPDVLAEAQILAEIDQADAPDVNLNPRRAPREADLHREELLLR